MKKTGSALFRIAGIVTGLSMPAAHVLADTASYKQLSGEWWQWMLSIPASQSPLIDPTGEKCMVGQRGSDWFLAGTFGGTATRTCEVPEGAALFFPVINAVNFDTPNVCGQGPDPIPASVYRAAAAAFIDGASNLSVTVDGTSVAQLHRVASKVFFVALPQDNLFAGFCDPPLPAGIYSPTVDDGIYVRLSPLAVGPHTLRIHAENPSASFVVDVTYHLQVVPLRLE